MTGSMVRPMAGRVCVVTGASSGIGRAASAALAALGASVVLVCRDRARDESAMAEAGAAAAGGQPSLELADLSSPDQVWGLTGRLCLRPRIGVLVNNAGLVVASRQLTADGSGSTFTVSHLAEFLLTNLLTPVLEASAPARVITISPVAHRAARLSLDDLQLERRYLAMRACCISKLASILFIREPAGRLDPGQVTADCLHPGTVRTRFGDTGAFRLRADVAAGGRLLRTPESGAQRVMYLAAAPEACGQTGGYYFSRRRRPSRAARDGALSVTCRRTSLLRRRQTD